MQMCTDSRRDVKWCLLQCLCAIGVVVGVVCYRMSVLAALHLHDTLSLDNATFLVSVTASVINVVSIFILNFVSGMYYTAVVFHFCVIVLFVG